MASQVDVDDLTAKCAVYEDLFTKTDAKLKELEDHLHTWDVDICCLQELCIQADQAEFREGLFRSWGYKLWLTLAPGAERANHRGSLAMLTRIKSEQIDLQLRQENEGRAQMVQVERGTTCTVIINVHFPHEKAAKDRLLSEITTRAAALEAECIIIGTSTWSRMRNQWYTTLRQSCMTYQRRMKKLQERRGLNRGGTSTMRS